MGLLLQKEVDVLLGLRNKPTRPFVAVLGGAKISDKLGVVEALLDIVDSLVIGGAMCFTFFAAQGKPIGDRCSSPTRSTRASGCSTRRASKAIHLPDDIIGLDAAGNYATFGTSLPDGAKGFDIGPGSAAAFSDVDHGRPDGVLERPDGDVRGRPLRGRHPHGRPGDGRHEGVHRRRRRRLGGGARRVQARRRGRPRVDGGGASLELLELGDLPGLAALRGRRMPA